MEESGSQYDDSNRAFLQAFLARGTMTGAEAKPILAAIFTAHGKYTLPEGRTTRAEDVTDGDFNPYVTAANDAISPFDLAILSTLSQHDRTRIYALVNTTSDAITQLATTHTAEEISYLKRLLDAMFETYNTPRQEVMALQAIQAVQLCKAPTERGVETPNGGATQSTAAQGLTMMAAERMLKEMVQEGWFEKSRAGFYSLSPRALMELKHYLLATYNGGDEEDQDEEEVGQDRVKLCFACKDIITVGQRCDDRGCPGRLHNICTEGQFRVQNSSKCPVCSKPWTGNSFVGEKAVTTSEAYLKGRRISGGGAARGRKSTQRQPAVDSDSGDDNGEDG
ncbi:MAG: hypothetical protein M1817_002817 [Caeruleum heppii]|nr:MAG: hypothetical protein M1817_002817 [Caeruleum heppii]